MAVTVFLAICAGALAFMVRFLMALRKETSHVVDCRPVSVYFGVRGGQPSGSRATSRNAEMVHARHNPSAA
jgi:hypothetical protein